MKKYREKAGKRINKDEWEKRKQEWNQFEKWKSQQKEPVNFRKNIRLVGEWVDFFLSRYPNRKEVPDVSGIVRMQKALSKLKLA